MLTTLHKQGKSDREIAEVIGKSKSWVYLERARLGLKTNHPKDQNVHYSEALKPEQCEEMHRFLTTLKACYRMAQAEGVKPRIDEFMREWAGIRADEKWRKYYKRKKEAKG